MELVRIQNKIKLLYEKLAEPGYEMNTYYADSFINKISNCSDQEVEALAAMPLMPDLIVNALCDTENYHHSVRIFLARTVAVTCKIELHFAKILSRRSDKLVEYFSGIDSPIMNPSLRVAYMEIAMALVSHNSGICWLVENGHWKKILSLYNKPVTVFVTRLVYKFATEFLWKLNDLGDQASLSSVIDFILKPVQDFDLVNIVSITMEQEEEMCNTLEPIFHTLLSVICRKDRYYQSNLIMNILIKENNIVTVLYILSDRIRKDNILLLIMKLLFSIALLRVIQTKPCKPGVLYSAEECMDLNVIFFNTMQFLIQKRNVTLVLDYCCFCNSLWTSSSQNSNAELMENGRKVALQNQMLFVCLVPILVYVNSRNRGRSTEATNERINEYISRFLNMTCQHTARAAYALRDLIVELDSLSVTLQSVKRLTCMYDTLNDGQANIVFQALYFVLREYDPTDDDGEIAAIEENYEDSEEKVLVMTYVMHTVHCLVKHYNINWLESLEVICLNTVVHNILTKRPNLSCKFVVAALGVMAVTVKKFLPPNLSLLLESQPGSAMHEIGRLIYMKIHDMNWEVRDSALELLHVCTEISYIKFPPIQKQITENNLINIAATIALNDHEPYVQASALKCVGAASRIGCMWDQIKTEHPDIMDYLISMLRHNQEGQVRKEVCNVLIEIYQNVKLTPETKHMLCEHMVSSALSDFHWEVQMSALKFWRSVIQSLLTDQGMLDGTFPPVTFSRESRKIVTLTEGEIRKRLQKLLDELANIGCLTVLLRLLNDNNEVEVMETALSISQDLFTILQRYKVQEIIKPIEDDPRCITDLKCCVRDDELFEYDDSTEEMEPESSTKADNVLEDILNSDDMNLLTRLYQNKMTLETKPKLLTPKIRLIKIASPYLFLNFLSVNDCKAIINQKREWNNGIRSVSSLLDDVLGLYEENEEANSLDCY